MAYLSHLVAITPTSAHAEDYANAVSRTSTMRKLVDAASRISSMGYQDTDDIGAALRQAEAVLQAIDNPQARLDGPIPLREVYDEFLEERADVGAGPARPVFTGYASIDELLGGIKRGQVVIVGARPSVGKTSLALGMVLNAARQGSVAEFVSLEMSRSELPVRVLAAEAQVDPYRMALGLLTNAEEARIMDSIGRLSELPLYIDDTPQQTVGEIRRKAKRLAAEQGLDLLAVDYLQLVQGRARENREQEVSGISAALKGLARELACGMVVCSQLSRRPENRPDRRPILSDLRESGSIEQDADVVMFIHRPDRYITEDEWCRTNLGEPYPKGVAEIIVAKNRSGPVGTLHLALLERYAAFEEFLE